MKKSFAVLWAFALLAASIPAQAQDAPKESTTTVTKTEKPAESKPKEAYKVEFVLRELQDGKAINSRYYMMIMEEGYGGREVRIGSRIPVKTESLNYLDVGTNISCHHIEGQPPNVILECSIEVSSFSLPEERSTAGANSPPVLNQMKSSISAVVQEGKQTVIGAIDDPSSTKRYEIALTATKVR